MLASRAMTPRTSTPSKALAMAVAVLPVLALLLLLATTSGETAIAPRGLVVAAAVVLFGVLAGTGGRSPRSGLDLTLAALMGLVAGHLLLFPGIPRGHDTMHHLWGSWAVARDVAAGSPGALWLHRLGLGMPVLQFYGPGTFYVTLPFSLAGLSPIATVKAGLLAFGAVAGMTMYAAVSRWTGDRRAGLVAATAYAFAPYRLLDSHYRGAFAECAALALLPLVIYFAVAAVREGGWRRLAVAAAPAAVLIVTHPISALMTALGLSVWAVAELVTKLWVRGSSPRFQPPPPRGEGPLRQLAGAVTRLAGVWVLGAALAGFFVVPFLAGSKLLVLGRYVQGEERTFFRIHGLVPGDLAERRLWTSLRTSGPKGDPIDGTDQEMPLYVGGVLLALLPLAAGLGRFPGETRKTPAGLTWMTLAALALTLRPGADALSLVLPPASAIQFPWRFLGLASFGLAAGAGFAAVRLLCLQQLQRRWTVLVPGTLAALLVLDAFPYTGAPDWLPEYQGFGHIYREDPDCGEPWGCWEHEPMARPYPFRAAGMFLPPADPDADVSLFCCAFPEYSTPAVRNAFTPIRDPAVLARAGVGAFVDLGGQEAVRLRAAPYAIWWTSGQPPEPRPFTRNGGEVVVRLDGRPGSVQVLEQNFPGWQVLTGDGWSPVRPARTGVLRARVEAGQTEVRFRYWPWTAERIAGWLVTLATAAALLVLSRRGD